MNRVTLDLLASPAAEKSIGSPEWENWVLCPENDNPENDEASEGVPLTDTPTTTLDVRVQLPDEVINQLPKREPEPSAFWTFVNQPMVLTLLGGLLAGVLTTWWQENNKTRELEVSHNRTVTTEQLALMKEMDVAYENTGSVINGIFSRILWMAEEDVKSKTITDAQAKKKSEEKVTQWRGEIHKFEEKLFGALPLENVLIRVEVLYRCASVQTGAKKMGETWASFQSDLNGFIRKRNKDVQMSAEEIGRVDTLREEKMGQLAKQSLDLMREMTGEVKAGPSPAACPGIPAKK